jgi:hypothetical protein
VVSAQKICLTGEGVLVFQKACPLRRRAQDEATRRLGADGLKALETVVARMKE